MFYVEPTLWVNGFPLRTPLGEGHLGTLESTLAEVCLLVRSFLSAPPSLCYPPCCSPCPYPGTFGRWRGGDSPLGRHEACRMNSLVHKIAQCLGVKASAYASEAEKRLYLL